MIKMYKINNTNTAACLGQHCRRQGRALDRWHAIATPDALDSAFLRSFYTKPSVWLPDNKNNFDDDHHRKLPCLDLYLVIWGKADNLH